MGDVVAWVPLSIYHNESDEYVPEYNNSDYYVQGLYLYGNEATGDVTDDMVENVDYYLYRSSYTDENGQIVNTESKMAIVTPVELKLTETESGLKIAGYYQISNYIIDNVLYDTYGGKYYPVNVSYYEYDSTAKKYIEVSSNGTNPWVYDVGPLEEAYTLFNGMNWRESTEAVVFKVFVDDGWELKNVTYKDNSGEGNVQLIVDSYHIIPDGALTINVYSAKTSDVIETTIVSKNGASMTTSGDDTYYSSMTLVVDELDSNDGSGASQLVISKLGGDAKAIAYDIHMERDGSECPVLEGDSVTVTLPVPEGWNADDILVFYVADDGTVTDMDATPSVDGNTVTFTTTHFSAYVMAQKDQPYPFEDVNIEGSHKPYADAILWAADEAITTGYGDGSFRPDNPCTRAQVVTFLWRAAGSPEPERTENPFADVSHDGSLKPYYKAILWAVEQGITSGVTKTQFAPNSPCTRAQFVTFLWRYEGKPDSSGSIGGFKDADTIAAPYQSAVAWAVEEGVTTGYGDSTFRPNNACTRAQVVTFLYRAMN